MKKVKTLIVRTAGTNCDQETAFAFKSAGSIVKMVHINELVNKKSLFKDFQIFAIPGGFTYGDDIASGKVLANEIKSKLKKELLSFVRSGKLIIGICNGFQVLVKMGLLPDVNGRVDLKVNATLSLNDSGKFEDRWVYLKNEASRSDQSPSGSKCVWAGDLPEVIYLPVAHAEGKFISGDDKVLHKLKKNGQIVFRYSDENGAETGYPGNPNGSVESIAGICDPTGRILGMMPHPERHISYLQHPNWRRNTRGEEQMGTGIEIFNSGVKFARKHLLGV